MKLFTKRAAKKKSIDAIARSGGAARADPTLTVVATIPICESREESDRMVEVLSPAADALEARTREGTASGARNSKKAAAKKRKGTRTTSRRKKVWEIEAEREAAARKSQVATRKTKAHKQAARERPSSSSRGRYQRGPSPGLSLDSLPEDAVLDERPPPGLSSKARAELDIALDADAVGRGPTSPTVIREYAPTLSPLSNRSGATMRVDNRRKAKTPTAQRSMRSFRSLFAPALVQESFSEDEDDEEEDDDETEAEEEGSNMLPELDSLFRAAKRAKDSLVGGAAGRGSDANANLDRVVMGNIDVVADDDESLEVPIGGNGWASILGCTALRCTDGAEARANANDDFVVGEGEGEEVDIRGGDEATLATYDTRTVDEQTVDTNTVDTPLAEEIRAAIPSLTHLFGAHPAEDETLGTVPSLETYDSRAVTADGSGTLATGVTGTTGSRTTAATSTSETTYESTLEGSSYETEDTDGSDVTEGDIKRSWMRALGFRFGARKKELAIAAASHDASERPGESEDERRDRLALAKTTALALGASASSDGTGSKAGRSKAGSVVQRLRKGTASSSLAGMIDKFVADRQQARGEAGSPDTILTEKPSAAEEAKATEEMPTATPEPAAKEEAPTTTTEQEATEPEATKPEATEATKPEDTKPGATDQKATEKEATEEGLESEAKIAETPNAAELTSEPAPEPESKALANETTPIASAPEPAPKVEAIVETPVAAETPAPANQDVRQAPTPTIGMYAAADVAYGSRSASKSVAPLKPPKEARSLSSRSRARSLRSMHRRRHSAHAPAIFDKMLAIGAAKKEGAALPRGRAQSEEVSTDPTKWIAETIDDRNAGVEVLASAHMMAEGRDDRDEEPVAFPSVAADEERDDAPRDDGEGSVTDLRSVGTDSLMLQAEVLLGQ